MKYTEGIPSPDIFRLWSGITAISGALERRVWCETARAVLYPNLYTLLVAAPGIGKTQAITQTEELWRSVKKFFVSPKNVTKAAMLDALERADRKIITPSGVTEYHTMLIAADEFGVFAPAHDLEFFSVLSSIYDNPRVHDEERRHNVKRLEIIHPQLVMLAGVQPGFMASLLPEEAWQQGFTARIIMVYSARKMKVPLFKRQEPRVDQFKILAKELEAISNVYGQITWNDDAVIEMERWVETGMVPEPEHSKLMNYNTRRALHIIKLSMISCISRRAGLQIQLEDLTRARDWLLGAEETMPDVFREMVQKSDGQVIQDLHYHIWKMWVAGKQKPIHESRLIHFLQQRVPSEKVIRVMEIAERSNIFSRLAGDSKLYIPKPRHEHGME